MIRARAQKKEPAPSNWILLDKECSMHSKTFLAIILMILALVFVTACERGEKGEKDEDEDEKAPTATTSTQPPVNLPAGKAATYNFDQAAAGALPPNFISARTGGG